MWALTLYRSTIGKKIIMAVTGLVLWRSNAHAAVKMDPLAEPPPRGAQLRLLPVTGLRWTGLALNASF